MNIYAAIMWVAIIGCIWHAAKAHASETAKQGRREDTEQARRELEYYQAHKSDWVYADEPGRPKWKDGAPQPRYLSATMLSSTIGGTGIIEKIWVNDLCIFDKTKPSSPATEPTPTKPQQPHQQPYTGKETKPQ